MDALLSLVLVCIAASLCIYGIVGDARRTQLADEQAGARPAHRLVLYLERLPIDRVRAYLETLLIRAGRDQRHTPDELLARQIVMSGVAGFIGAVVGGAPLALVGAAVGSMHVIWLRKIGGQRMKEVERSLPTTIDMLRLSVEAGLDYGQALERIASRGAPSSLNHELARMVGEMKVGISRREALLHMADRIGLSAMRSVVTALVQADRLGSSIGAALKGASQHLREERLMRAERAGALAAHKALLPCVLFIMPATFIVIFGPLAARYLAGGFQHVW